MEERKMTIARGLTRLKTIKAQVMRNNEILLHSCINSKQKSRLADAKLELKENHRKAAEEVASTMKSTQDLMTEYAKIKMAISKANLSTLICVAGKTMTIAEAMIMRQDVAQMMQAAVSSYMNSYNRVTSEVNRHNDLVMANQNATAEDKKVMMAEVYSFIPFDGVKEMGDFSTVFLSEMDGVLNEVNALTEIVVE